jgi:hypothetical protein
MLKNTSSIDFNYCLNTCIVHADADIRGFDSNKIIFLDEYHHDIGTLSFLSISSMEEFGNACRSVINQAMYDVKFNPNYKYGDACTHEENKSFYLTIVVSVTSYCTLTREGIENWSISFNNFSEFESVVTTIRDAITEAKKIIK